MILLSKTIKDWIDDHVAYMKPLAKDTQSLNTVVAPGIYYLYGNELDRPVELEGSDGLLIVINNKDYEDNRLQPRDLQLIISYESLDIFYRTKSNADTVYSSAWKKRIGETVSNPLTPVDGSLIIKNDTIQVGISAEDGNVLTKKKDGLYVGAGQSGHYAPGLGLTLVDGTFSVKLANNTHGLVAINGALSLDLATKDSDGAMSKEDKAFLETLKEFNISDKFATKEEVEAIKQSVTDIEQVYTWSEM